MVLHSVVGLARPGEALKEEAEVLGETDVCRRMVRTMVRTLQLQLLSLVRAHRPPCESQTASLQTRTSQFLKLNLFPLSLSTHTPCEGCFPGNPAHAATRPTRPARPTQPARALRRYGEGLPAGGLRLAAAQ